MFTRAGVNTTDFRVICYARARSDHGSRRLENVYLLRWASGDIAWACNAWISWPEHVEVQSAVPRGKDFYKHRRYHYGEDRSNIDDGGFRLKEKQAMARRIRNAWKRQHAA